MYCGALGAGVRAVGRPPCSRAPCRIVVALSAPAAAMGTKRRRYAEDVCHLPHTSTSGTRQSGSQHVRARRVWPHMRSARCRHAWCHALLSGVREASMVHYAAPHLQSPRLVVEFDGCTCANHRAPTVTTGGGGVKAGSPLIVTPPAVSRTRSHLSPLCVLGGKLN